MNNDLIETLKDGGIAVIPTDTIYGIVGLALNPQTVEKIYKLRKRAKDKPFIILISSIGDLKQFEIELTDNQKEFLEKHWPNPLSVVLSCKSERFKYLHRGTYSLAFRVPKNEKLLFLLKQVGPLVAPSANFEGEKAANNIAKAKEYFGNQIGFYLDRGTIYSTPSTLVKFDQNSLKILRQGDLKV